MLLCKLIFLRLNFSAVLFFVAVFACAQNVLAASSVLQPSDAEFDHFATNFELTGQHKFIKCEACHTDTDFKTTPNQCSGCHNEIIALGKSINHIQTTAECDLCHSTEGFLIGAKMDHSDIAGACASCHNGTTATGKTSTHIATTDACEACHQTVSWIPVTSVDHDEVSGDSCFSCHNNEIAIGKTVDHITSSNFCDTCHSTVAFVPAFFVDHSEFLETTDCTECHTKSPNHGVTSDRCLACHTVTNWSVAAGGVDHGEVLINVAGCITCHSANTTGFSTSAVNAPGQPLDHIPTGAVSCDVCHSVVAWIPATFTHTEVAVDKCVMCHTSGVRATPRSPTHIASTTVCDACHSGYVAWQPLVASAVDHTQVIGVCSSCHDGLIAIGKGATHVVTPLECDTCHNTGAWTPASVDHAAFSGNCITCHNTIIASGKSAAHLPSSNECDTCHQKLPALWTPVANTAVDHNQTIGVCIDCHNGAGTFAKTAKSTLHIPTTNVCDACHQPGPALWQPVAPAAVDHAQVVGVCIDCHNGTLATGKTATHARTSEVCDACHANLGGWAPLPGLVDHLEVVSGGCNDCHGTVAAIGALAVGAPVQPLDHIPIGAVSCDACHNITAWIPATFTHTEVVVDNCVMCHVTGIRATAKSPTHIASTDVCVACHSGFALWQPLAVGAVDHTQVIGVCSSCHDGVIATGKAVTHTPTIEECDNCHSTAAWLPAAVNHDTFSGNCATCHGVTASGKSATHIPSSAVCDACHQKFPATWAPVAPAAVDHTQVVGVCSTCHDGTLATGKSAMHLATTAECDICHDSTAWVPLTTGTIDHTTFVGNCVSCHNGTLASAKSLTHIATSDACDACHQVSPALWAPVASAAVDHTQVIGVCSSCHNGAIATGKAAAHIPTIEQCDICHSTDAWKPAAVNHDAFVAGDCLSCHNGVIASGKSATHILSLNVCDACHQRFPATWAPLVPAAVDHTQVIGVCSSCHNGTSGKSVTHIPTTNNCVACHAVGPTPWIPVAPTAVDHIEVVGACSGCHNGTVANGKSPTHIPTTNVCNACHAPGPAQWTPVASAAVDHAQVVGVCSTCHNGTLAVGKSANHVSTALECDSCHSTNAWTPTFTVDHTLFVGNCISCHDGVTASGKSATHMPTTNICDACHQASPIPWTPVARGAFDHAEVAAVCSTCHNGTVATGKDIGHIVTVAECDNCHTTIAWTPAITIDHSTFVGNCITCHDGVQASGKHAAHIPSNDICDACHQKFPAKWAPVAANAVDHSAVIGACFVCHNVDVAVGKSANHIPTSNICDACHSTAIWTPTVVVDHTQVSGACFDCHNGTIASGKTPTHPTTTNLCEACHLPAPVSWAPLPAGAVDHTQVLGICSSCHNNVIAQGLTPDHCDTLGAECDLCHTTSGSFGGNAFADCVAVVVVPPPVAPPVAPAPAPGGGGMGGGMMGM